MEYGKYIIVSEMGHEVPILFSSPIEHSAFLKCFHKDFIKAAGFFEVYSDQDDHDYHFVNTFGNSTSLDLTSREEDTKIIEKFINRN